MGWNTGAVVLTMISFPHYVGLTVLLFTLYSSFSGIISIVGVNIQNLYVHKPYIHFVGNGNYVKNIQLLKFHVTLANEHFQ